MNLKTYTIALSIILFLFGNCFAQELKFDFDISLNQNIFWAKDKNIIAKISITNKSEQILDTSKLNGLAFYLSKCPKVRYQFCSTHGENFVSSVKIKSKFLKKDESLEFEVSLADLYWIDAISNSIDFKYPKNLNKVPISNKYFYGVISVFEKYLEVKDFPSKIPISKPFFSNEIVQKTTPK
ncbi:MAG: hypothetical protein K1X72_02040 [Pyrinomonadaceae bacterium]|nr:hypothetical protein [Pyrinomonadaceae bacterium]